MKITFDIPDNVMALTNVFYTKEENGMTQIYSWTIAPKAGSEYSVVENPDGTRGVIESVQEDSNGNLAEPGTAENNSIVEEGE